MAKLRVIPWEENRSRKEVHLASKRSGDTMDIFARREDGGIVECGLLLTLSDTGLTRHPGVNPDLGLPLDSDGRIKLDE